MPLKAYCTKSVIKNTKRKNLSKKVIDLVWSKAKIVNGKDPKLYRQDPYGNIMYYHSYGKNTPMGWHIDHIKPISRGGSNNIRNLQVLDSKVNIKKGNSLIKKSRHNNK